MNRTRMMMECSTAEPPVHIPISWSSNQSSSSLYLCVRIEVLAIGGLQITDFASRVLKNPNDSEMQSGIGTFAMLKTVKLGHQLQESMTSNIA